MTLLIDRSVGGADTRPPLPPFTLETATQKVRIAEDGWNSRDPERLALAYSPQSRWRNRAEFVVGREQIVAFLRQRELGVRCAGVDDGTSCVHQRRAHPRGRPQVLLASRPATGRPPRLEQLRLLRNCRRGRRLALNGPTTSVAATLGTRSHGTSSTS